MGARQGHTADPRALWPGAKLPSPTPNCRQWLNKGIYGAFPERGSREGVTREGGAWPGSLTQAGHVLLGSWDLGRGSFLAWAPGSEAQKTLPVPCDSDELTLPTPSACSLGPGLVSSWPHPGCRGRRQQLEFKYQPCAVLPQPDPDLSLSCQMA